MSERAVVRLFGAMMLEQNDDWPLERRRMQLDALRRVSIYESLERA